jgi:Zn-dependent oligopeptidase
MLRSLRRSGSRRRFTPVPDAPSASPDIRAWAVSRGGPAIGYLYIDAHPREGKEPGARTLPYRDQQHLTPGRLPVVMVSYNLPRSQPGQRAPIGWLDAVGMFHEFGHALQALLSDDDLPALMREVDDGVRAPPQVLPISVAAQASYLFGDDNYSAQFYSYLWSDELASAVYAAFSAAGGPYDRAVAERLRAAILSRGSAVDPAAAIAAFLGRAPGIDELLVRRGFGGSRAGAAQ